MKAVSRLLAVPVAVASVVLGNGAAFAQTSTATDYTGTFDTTMTSLNFAGSSTSFVTQLGTKTNALMIGVLGLVIIAGIVWRLGMKSKKIAG